MAVLAGAIAAARERRHYDAVVLRVLGAGSAQLLGLVLAEQLILAGCWRLSRWRWHGWCLGGGDATVRFCLDAGWGTMLAVLAGATALVLAMAVGGSLSVLRTRPAQALRERSGLAEEKSAFRGRHSLGFSVQPKAVGAARAVKAGEHEQREPTEDRQEDQQDPPARAVHVVQAPDHTAAMGSS
jgi:hypothetical protein